jgi:hypothetical protein
MTMTNIGKGRGRPVRDERVNRRMSANPEGGGEAHHGDGREAAGRGASPGPASGPGSARRKYIVPCPACDGTGRIIPRGSLARVSCRLCWERGRVSWLVAERYTRLGNGRSDA